MTIEYYHNRKKFKTRQEVREIVKHIIDTFKNIEMMEERLEDILLSPKLKFKEYDNNGILPRIIFTAILGTIYKKEYISYPDEWELAKKLEQILMKKLYFIDDDER